jgi:hypothetical protein
MCSTKTKAPAYNIAGAFYNNQQQTKVVTRSEELVTVVYYTL